MSEAILPISAKVAAGLQALVGILVLFIWAAWATWGRLPSSLLLSSIIFFPALGLCIVAGFGLWKGKMFGWVMGIVGNGASAAVLLFFAGPFSILPVALLAYLLFPNVRDFYMRNYYQ